MIDSPVNHASERPRHVWTVTARRPGSSAIRRSFSSATLRNTPAQLHSAALHFVPPGPELRAPTEKNGR